MIPVVTDASIVAKWFIPEIHTEQAILLLKNDFSLIAPDLLFAEIGNVLWKKVLVKDLSVGEARNILQTLPKFPLRIISSRDLINVAFEIAHNANCTVYDSIYLAAAVANNCKMLTADHKFFKAIVKTTLQNHIVYIEDMSSISPR